MFGAIRSFGWWCCFWPGKGSSQNSTLGRYALIAMFILAVGGMPILENPQSSVIMHHDRMKWLLSTWRKHGIFDPWLCLIGFSLVWSCCRNLWMDFQMIILFFLTFTPGVHLLRCIGLHSGCITTGTQMRRGQNFGRRAITFACSTRGVW